MGADPTRIYLRPYLINLALLIKDVKTSYSIVIKETNSIKYLRNKMTNHLSKRRIALMSFAGSCGIVSNILWPNIPKPKCDINGHPYDITKLDKKKAERKDHLKDLFPQNCFPHLKKHFREFLMHSDERMDDFSIRNKNPSIAFNTNEHTLPSGNVPYWINIHPDNYTIFYYSEGKYKNVDIREMYLDILKLPPLIVNALGDIMYARIDSDYDMIRSIIGEK